MTIELHPLTLSALLWLLFLIGFLFGAFWAGRERDDREDDVEQEWQLPRDDAVERLLRRNRELRK